MDYQMHCLTTPRIRHTPVDFDVGKAETIEQNSLEIEEITITGEHHVVTETGLVPDITITGEQPALSE